MLAPILEPLEKVKQMRILCVLLVAITPGIAAQQPTATQVQQALQEQPGLADQVRSRIAQSGLTPDQVRARLTASGYPSTLLDSYMSATPTAGVRSVPGAQELAALQALGMTAMPTQVLPFDTGLVRRAPAGGAPSDVFGVDVFRRTTTQF